LRVANEPRHAIPDQRSRPKIPRRLQQPSAVWKIKNYGLTPAYNPEICAQLVIVDGVSLSNARANVFSFCNRNSTYRAGPTIWPAEERTQGGGVTPDEVVAMAQGKSVYFLGRILYKDAWQKQRHTFVCRLVSLAKGQLNFLGCSFDDVHDDLAKR
jgi:hypothetical protein